MRVHRGWMAIKINMEKAYDRSRWDFIKDTLKNARLPSKLVRLIMQCVSSPTMQVLWNGGLMEDIVPSKGAREGDPVSPYLFILTIERLGHMIQEVDSRGS